MDKQELLHITLLSSDMWPLAHIPVMTNICCDEAGGPIQYTAEKRLHKVQLDETPRYIFLERPSSLYVPGVREYYDITSVTPLEYLSITVGDYLTLDLQHPLLTLTTEN